MHQPEIVAILDMGAAHVQQAAEVIESLGFPLELVKDLAHLQRVEGCGVILLPSCPRAGWMVEQIRSHPRLSEVPLLGFGDSPEDGLDDFWGWPLQGDTLGAALAGWLAEGRSRRARAEAADLLSGVIQAGRLVANRSELDRSVGPYVVRAAELLRSPGAALMVLGRNEREAFVVASTEQGDGLLVPMEERAALSLAMCIEGGQVTDVEIGLLAMALEREPRDCSESCLSFPVMVASQPVGALLFSQEPDHHLPTPLRRAGELLAQILGSALAGSPLMQRIREQTSKVSLQKVSAELGARSLRRYKEFFESSPDGVLVLDSEGKVLYINQAGAMMTGYASKYLVGRPLAEIVAEHHREGLVEVLQSVSDDVDLRNFDLQILTTSEDHITVAVSTSSLKLDKTATVFTFRDVTEARVIEDELINTKEFLERLIASAVDAIVAADSMDGTIILFNQGAENLFGRAAEETVGKVSLDELFPAEEYEDLLRQLHSPHFGGEGRLEQSHKHVRDAGGRHVPVSMTASIISDDMREVALVAIITDLREQLQIQERLALTQERLEVTEKQALIAELAGTTAHELNQPLTSVMGYAELLIKKMGPDSPFASSMGVIMNEAERMAEIVRKIGKITRYETKSYVGETQILDLDRAAEE